MLATRFPDGIVRLHVGDRDLGFARQLPVAEVQRSLILSSSAVYGGGRHDPELRRRFANLLDRPALDQAYAVCRVSEARWCVPQRPRFTRALYGRDQAASAE